MKRSIAAWLVATLSLAINGIAHADEPPPPDSIEAHCTSAEQCPSGLSCERNVADAEVGKTCRAEAAQKKLERRCRRGVTHSRELFCPPGEKGSWSKGCAFEASDARENSSTFLLGGVLALALALLRRRRARSC